jgi:hypothetical protein
LVNHAQHSHAVSSCRLQDPWRVHSTFVQTCGHAAVGGVAQLMDVHAMFPGRQAHDAPRHLSVGLAQQAHALHEIDGARDPEPAFVRVVFDSEGTTTKALLIMCQPNTGESHVPCEATCSPTRDEAQHCIRVHSSCTPRRGNVYFCPWRASGQPVGIVLIKGTAFASARVQ